MTSNPNDYRLYFFHISFLKEVNETWLDKKEIGIAAKIFMGLIFGFCQGEISYFSLLLVQKKGNPFIAQTFRATLKMNIVIKKVWDKVRKDRWEVAVEIINGRRKFNYIPTYEDVGKIMQLLEEVEFLNRNLVSYNEEESVTVMKAEVERLNKEIQSNNNKT